MSAAALQASMPIGSQDEPMASRGLSSSPLGKLTAEVKSFRIPEATHEALERMSHDAGFGSVQEFVRELVMVRVHGFDTLAKLHADRLRVVAGTSRE